MQKRYISLGLMSGTSGDGVDASLIKSNGINEYESIKDKYFEYDNDIYKSYHNLKEKINFLKDLKKFKPEIIELERKITIFHSKVIKDINVNNKDFLIGFHGQTIFHNSEEKISYQLGDSRLLFQLIGQKIIFNFRENDILNGGQGAPLAPLFHQLMISQKKVELPVCVLNIGGISNLTIINGYIGSLDFFSKDIGPGNCLIDNWIRNNSEKKFDENGNLSKSGEINEIILEQAQELFANRKNIKKLSFDLSDFDISFARGLSLEDGARTLTELTANVLGEAIINECQKLNIKAKKILLCGGGRKNKFLIEKIQRNIKSYINLQLIDDFQINGDFVESQAFAFLAIRSFIKLPITFPNTTGCKSPCLGGMLLSR